MSQDSIVKFIDEFVRGKQRIEEKQGCKQRRGKATLNSKFNQLRERLFHQSNSVNTYPNMTVAPHFFHLCVLILFTNALHCLYS